MGRNLWSIPWAHTAQSLWQQTCKHSMVIPTTGPTFNTLVLPTSRETETAQWKIWPRSWFRTKWLEAKRQAFLDLDEKSNWYRRTFSNATFTRHTSNGFRYVVASAATPFACLQKQVYSTEWTVVMLPMLPMANPTVKHFKPLRKLVLKNLKMCCFEGLPKLAGQGRQNAGYGTASWWSTAKSCLYGATGKNRWLGWLKAWILKIPK